MYLANALPFFYVFDFGVNNICAFRVSAKRASVQNVRGCDQVRYSIRITNRFGCHYHISRTVLQVKQYIRGVTHVQQRPIFPRVMTNYINTILSFKFLHD